MATPTRPPVLMRSITTPAECKTRPPVELRSTTTPPAITTRRRVLRRSSRTLPATTTLLAAFERSIATPPVAATSPWALMPALVSPRPVTLLLSASPDRTSPTVAISAEYSVQPLPEELPYSLMQTADLAQPLPQSALRRTLNQ